MVKMETEKKIFSEYVQHYAETFGSEDLVKKPTHFRIANARQDIVSGLKYYIGDKAKWVKGYDEIVDWLEDNRGKGLLCMGSCGRGKTLICSKIIPIVLYKHFGFVFARYSMQDLANNLDEALDKKLLVIDDVGTENMSVKYGERRQPFAEIVDNAEKNATTMIVTTNLTAEELQEKYGVRVLDRLKEVTRLVMLEGESMRGR